MQRTVSRCTPQPNLTTQLLSKTRGLSACRQVKLIPLAQLLHLGTRRISLLACNQIHNLYDQSKLIICGITLNCLRPTTRDTCFFFSGIKYQLYPILCVLFISEQATIRSFLEAKIQSALRRASSSPKSTLAHTVFIFSFVNKSHR